MLVFRVIVALAWAAVLALSVHAVATLGVDQAGAVFIGDFAHAWRAQFNGDFAAHLLLVAAWMLYREQSLARGLVCAALAVLMGGVFSLAYVFVAAGRSQGSGVRLLLGARAPG